MQIGFAVPLSGSWATPRNQRHVAERAEQLGYASLWTFQRLLFPAGPDSGRWADAYRSVDDPLVTLAYLAAVTERIRLGVAVLNMPFFAPLVLAKQVASLDRVSDGRADLGLGIGWAPQEYAAVGAASTDRGRRADEYVRCLIEIWTADVVEFHGEFFQVPAAQVRPRPVQQPHPPILLGGVATGALRRAGRLADGWVSGSGADLRSIGTAVATVRAGAEEAGRDPERLRIVCRGAVRLREADAPADRRPLTGSLAQVREDLSLLAEQGVTETFVDLNFDPEIGSPDADPAASLRRAEQALEAFAPN